MRVIAAVGFLIAMPLHLMPQVGSPPDPLWIVGDHDDEWFQSIGVIEDGPGRVLLVADPAAARFAVLSMSGDLVRHVGTAGVGPGEFRTLSAFAVRGDTILAFDGVLRRQSSFTVDGTHLETRQVRQGLTSAVGVVVPMRFGAEVIATLPRFVRDGAGNDPFETVAIRWPDQTVDTLARIRDDGALWGNHDRDVPWGVAQTPFGDGGAWAVIGDSVVVVASGYEGVVSWIRVEDGSLSNVGQRALGLRARSVSEDDMAAVERDWRAEREFPARIDIEGPSRWSVASSVIADGSATWLRTETDRGNGESWVILDRSTEERIEFRTPAGFEIRHVTPTLVVGVSESGNGEPLVVAYAREDILSMSQ